jgi:heptosyltransferase-2
MPAPRILLVRFSSIGDLLLTTPLLRALRVRHPRAQITMVVREDLAETVRHNPRLSSLVTWRRGSPLSELAATLRQEEWTHRLDLHGSLRSLALRQLVGGSWTTYPKHRVRRTLLIRTHGARGGALGAVTERYFAAARDLDVTPDGGPAEFFTTQEMEAGARDFLAAAGLGEHRPLVALAPGAAHFTKRWPVEHWEALVRRLRTSNDLVILGGPSERALGDQVAAAGGDRAVNAAGAFSLGGSAALLKQAKALVSGDTGLLHLATAVGTPVVGLYGPTVEAFGFFPYQARARVLQRDLPCRPCSSHGGAECPEGHHRCLRDILPEDVAATVAGPIR